VVFTAIRTGSCDWQLHMASVVGVIACMRKELVQTCVRTIRTKKSKQSVAYGVVDHEIYLIFPKQAHHTI